MVVCVDSLGLQGIEGYGVRVECDLAGGLPAFELVGLPDAAVKEARERVRSAVKNCGFSFPVSRITVNLAPANRRKAGTVYDLPILLGILKASGGLDALNGQEFYGEYLGKTDPLGAPVPNPVSHVAYGYATQMCILDRETGRVKKMVAAHDVGKAVNPLSCEGQIEGGVVMSLGYALTEQYPIDENCKPTAKYGMLGLFRANQIPPEIQAIVVEKPGLNVAGGAIGIGEITSIPTAPAIADAYFRLDGQRRLTLPLENTPYARKK